jgi:predicted nucleic acid-binding Zn ribbon protein
VKTNKTEREETDPDDLTSEEWQRGLHEASKKQFKKLKKNLTMDIFVLVGAVIVVMIVKACRE